MIRVFRAPSGPDPFGPGPRRPIQLECVELYTLLDHTKLEDLLAKFRVDVDDVHTTSDWKSFFRYEIPREACACTVLLKSTD